MESALALRTRLLAVLARLSGALARSEREHMLWSAAVAVALLGLVVAACADNDKRASRDPSYTSGGGLYKVGSPYRINGQWYYPAVDYEYQEEGAASWYGADFHGRSTANGEVYDMEALTAAHRTLPLPSIVRVTNLENGRSTILRVNDRGPFAKGRIIDVSRRGAEILGFRRQGIARVRVEIVARESRDLHARLTGQAVPDEPLPSVAPATVALASVQPVAPLVEPAVEVVPYPETPQPAAASMMAPGGAASYPDRAQPAVDPTKDAVTSAAPLAPPLAPPISQTIAALPPASNIFVQAGAYTVVDNAQQAMAALTGVGPARIDATQINGTRFYRVRLGPLPSPQDAQRLLTRVINSGYADSHVVID